MDYDIMINIHQEMRSRQQQTSISHKNDAMCRQAKSTTNVILHIIHKATCVMSTNMIKS